VLCFWGRNRGEEIGARRKSGGAAGSSEGLRWWQRADWGALYRRDEAVEEGRTPVAGLGERCGAPLMAFVVATCGSAIRGGDAMVRAARTRREDEHMEEGGPAAVFLLASSGARAARRRRCALQCGSVARAARRPGECGRVMRVGAAGSRGARARAAHGGAPS